MLRFLRLVQNPFVRATAPISLLSIRNPTILKGLQSNESRGGGGPKETGMQGSLSLLPLRLSLQSLAALQSYRTSGVKTVGLRRFPHWQALEKPRAKNGGANDFPLLETVTSKSVALAGSTGNTNMTDTCFASTRLCSYKTEVTPSRLNWAIAASGKLGSSVQNSSCGIPKPVQRHTARQWLSLHTQGDYARKPVVRVPGKAGGQEVLVEGEKFEFKRLDSESDSITTFYSSDVSESDSESDKEGEHNSSREQRRTLTKLKADEDLDKEKLVITEDEIENYVEEIDISDEIEEELDEIDEDDDFWEDDDGDAEFGDGGTGGGVVLGGTLWGTKALDLAEQVVAEYGKDLSIFAFKVSSDRVIRVRLDKLSDRYGSPTMTDIENFSRKFSMALEEAGEAGTLPKDIDVEVSSPGAERVVRVPNELQRFKELPMYVQYLGGGTDQDGVFELDSVDMEGGVSVWKIANVKLNREVKGRGRPLNSKQKKWRATIPFASLKQVRLYLDV